MQTFSGGLRDRLSRWLPYIAVVLAIVLSAGVALAQTETGQIAGTVTDASGAVIPNATITGRNLATGVVRSTTTNTAGLYVLPNLTPGDWGITTGAQGFASRTAKITLAVGAKVEVNARLEVGQTATTVEVASSGAAQVNTESQSLSNTIDTQQVLELPSLTRNPYDFVSTVPNVSADAQSGRGVGYAINGMRSDSANVMLDGTANNDEFGAGVGQQVPVDSVQEYQLITSNFTAEYGRASGGIVNVLTKGGTNDFHGSVYEFNRLSALASNSYWNNANELPKGIYTRNNFGYSLGGPIKKNKMFFFQNTEWTRVRSYANEIAMIPTSQLIAASAPATQAFFSAYGALRSGLGTLNTYTKAQLPTICSGAATGGPCQSLPSSTPMFSEVAYQTPADAGGGSPQNTYDLVGNVDYNLSEKTQMSVRYALYNEDDFAGTVNTSPYKGYETGQTNVDNHITYSLTRTFSPTLVSQSRISFNRLNNQQPLGTDPVSPTLYMNASSAPSLLGHLIAFPGYSEYSPGNAIPFGGPQNFGVASEDVTKVHGRHNIRFGGQYTYFRDNRTFGAYEEAVEALGTNNGNSMDNFLNGLEHQFEAAVNPQGKFPGQTVTLPVGPPSFSRSNRYNEGALYAQDSFHATSRLTLNYGLRWEYFGVQHNKNANLDSNMVLGTGSTIQQEIANATVDVATNSPVGGLWHKDYKDFSPRVGFAYALTKDGKTSLRGGYGIGYERNFGNVTFNIIQNPPNYAVLSLVAGTDLPTIPISVNNAGPLAGNSGSKVLPAVSLRAVDQNIKNAYAHQYGLSLEREVTGNVVASLSYSGSAGERLYSIDHFNLPSYGNLYLGVPCTPGTFGDPGTCTTRLNTQYGNINERTNGAASNYNAMIARVITKNVAHSGATLDISYTWSHSLDDLSSTFSDGTESDFQLGFMDPFHPKLDWGNSDFETRQRFTVSGVWAIPGLKGTSLTDRLLGGWELAPILTVQTGNPFSIYDCSNAYSYCPRAEASGPLPDSMKTGIQTPGVADNFELYGFTSQPFSVGTWYNPKTGISDDGPFPSNILGRNTVFGPMWYSFNLGAYKNTRIKERVSLQLRLEMYNALNHARYYVNGADADVSSYNFLDGYRDGHRDIQLGAKIRF